MHPRLAARTRRDGATRPHHTHRLKLRDQVVLLEPNGVVARQTRRSTCRTAICPASNPTSRRSRRWRPRRRSGGGAPCGGGRISWQGDDERGLRAPRAAASQLDRGCSQPRQLGGLTVVDAPRAVGGVADGTAAGTMTSVGLRASGGAAKPREPRELRRNRKRVSTRIAALPPVASHEAADSVVSLLNEQLRRQLSQHAKDEAAEQGQRPDGRRGARASCSGTWVRLFGHDPAAAPCSRPCAQLAAGGERVMADVVALWWAAKTPGR